MILERRVLQVKDLHSRESYIKVRDRALPRLSKTRHDQR
jgi:hypothetical protein